MTDTAINEKRRDPFTPEARAKAAATRKANALARKAGTDAKPPKAGSTQLAGLTPTDCPAACNATACVFTDKPYCGHPYKGGPQAADISRPEVLSRQSEAKRILGKRKVDLRHA